MKAGLKSSGPAVAANPYPGNKAPGLRHFCTRCGHSGDYSGPGPHQCPGCSEHLQRETRHEAAGAAAGLPFPTCYDASDRFICLEKIGPASHHLESAHDSLRGIGAIADLLRASADEAFDFENADPGTDEERLARPFSERTTDGLHAALGILALHAMCKLETAAEILAGERGAA